MYTDVQLDPPDLNVGIENIEVSNDFSAVFPNPVDQNSSVYVNHEGGFIDISIIDITGKIVQNILTGDRAKQLITKNILIDNLTSNGLYILRVYSNGKTEQHKILVH